ncbi:hypothetical protein V6N13_024841 [Hibiscus sabdariffa]
MAHRRANAITTLKHSDGLWCSDISMEVDFYKALFTSSNLHGAEFSTRGASKLPGVDVLDVGFFQDSWEVVSENVCKFIHQGLIHWLQAAHLAGKVAVTSPSR